MLRTPLGRSWSALLCAIVACTACAIDFRPLAVVPAAVAAQPRVQPPEIAQQQLLVGFDPDTPEAEREAIVVRRGGRTVQRLGGAQAYLVELPPQRPLGVGAARFADDGAVRYVEPNYRYRIAAVPDDPRRGDLWGLDAIGAPAAWERTTGSADLVVGVVDSGIDHDHLDLAANMWAAPSGWNLSGCVRAGSHGYRSIGGVTGCAPVDTDDDNGHGTHVAGTIGAVGDNGTGVVGVNWTVKLMSLKAIAADGNLLASDAVAVINYAVAARQAGVNLRVLNLSWGGPVSSEPLRIALANANAAGILVVAAAGDLGTDNDVDPFFPASYGSGPNYLPNVIAVAATATNDIYWDLSNRGSRSVHLAAPGYRIWSTDPGDRYDIRSGTSMAAAYVSGAAALVLGGSGLASLGVASLKARLLECGDLLPVASQTITDRRLNVARALAFSDCPIPSYAVTADASPTAGGSATVSPTGTTFPAGTAIVVTATPAPGFRFIGWRVDGANWGMDNPLSITISSAHAIQALFSSGTFALALSATAGGQVSAAPSVGPYEAGTTVYLVATPDAGFRFVGWTIDGAAGGNANPLPLLMDRNRAARANFAPFSSPGTAYALDLAAIGNGTVAADSPGPYQAGAKVKLAATPGAGAVFTGWTIDGAPAGAANPLTLTMNADRTVRANFAAAHAFRLSWTQGGNARVDTMTWAGDSPYPAGTVLTLTANTNSDYVFTGWTIDNTFQGWANPLTLTMDGSHSVVANFARRRHFTDLPPGPPPYEAISQLAARQIILGYSNGTFGPTDTTQRAQMAALIARAMGWDREDHGNLFTDRNGIDPNLWRNVGTLEHYGVAKGYGDGRFGTLDRVLQVQVISFITRGMVARGLWVAETADDPGLYPNVPLSTGHRLDLVTYYRNAGAVPGTVPTQPWPDWLEPSTRGWFAEALWRALDRHYSVDRVP